MANSEKVGNVSSGLAWTMAERLAAQIVSTVVSIVLARMLDPEHYGIISVVMVFISFCNVLVSEGFGKTLVQKKNADKADFDTMFWLSFSFSLCLYAVLFFAAPLIQKAYQLDMLSSVLRVLGMRLILISVNTVQQAYVQRKMAFKKFFMATFAGTVASAVVGIAMAYTGYGVWALVAQYMTNTLIGTVMLHFFGGWRPGMKFSREKMRDMLPFSLRVTAQSLVFSLEDSIKSIVISSRFGSEDLAFYNKGLQFPLLLTTNINMSLGKVMLPALSRNQENIEQCKAVARRAITVGLYILCPVMLGFFAVGESFISIVLTDKWLPCVPYLRIICVAFLMRPFETTCSSAILALGRSDITLRNMIIINVTMLLSIVVAVMIFENPLMIAVSSIIGSLISVVLYSLNAKALLRYSIREQISDCVMALAGSISMALVVMAVGQVKLPVMAVFGLQILTGMVYYLVFSIIFRVPGFDHVKQMVFRVLRK